MAAVITNIQKVGAKVWRYDYSGTAPFRVYIDGQLWGGMSRTETFIIVQGDSDNEPVPIEVIDSTENESDVQQVKYPQRAILQWRSAEDTDFYLVERFVSGEWVVQRTIHSHPDATYHRYESDQLADVTTHQFRITAVNSSGDQGEPIPFDVLTVRNPPPPEIAVALAGGTITVSAA